MAKTDVKTDVTLILRNGVAIEVYIRGLSALRTGRFDAGPSQKMPRTFHPGK
jgi:hypothetical protein